MLVVKSCGYPVSVRRFMWLMKPAAGRKQTIGVKKDVKTEHKWLFILQFP